MTSEKTVSPTRPVGMYEVKFAVDHGAQDWAGLPGGSAYTRSGEVPGFTDGAIILPAYTAEDALTDFRTRMHQQGWHAQNIVIKSITPAPTSEPDK